MEVAQLHSPHLSNSVGNGSGLGDRRPTPPQETPCSWCVSLMSRTRGATLPGRPVADMNGAYCSGYTKFLAVALTKLMLMERSGILPPLDILVQTTLDRILDAQSTHCTDAHDGEVTGNVDCRTCVALFEAVSAARIAAVETTTLPKRAAQTRIRTPRKE
jgi:hypothetical protein